MWWDSIVKSDPIPIIYAEKKPISPIRSFEYNSLSQEPNNLFTRKGNKLIFNFRHSLNSEEVTEAYLKAKSYDRLQSRKFDKKKLLAALASKSNLETKGNFDSIEIDIEKKLTSDDKSSIWARRTKIHTQLEKNDRTQRVKRISATKNLIFDFENPLNSMSVEQKNSNLFPPKQINGPEINEKKRRSLATLPHLLPVGSSGNNLKTEFNSNFPNETLLPFIPKQHNFNRNFKSTSKNRLNDKKISRNSSEKLSLESNWQKLRQKNSNKILCDKTEASNSRLKKLYENFDKLNRKLDDFKEENDFLSCSKNDSFGEKTYRLPTNVDETKKTTKLTFKEELKDSRKNKSHQVEIENYLNKYALNFSKLKDEDPSLKEIHPSTKEVSELLERLNIRNEGFEDFDETPREKIEKNKTDQESQFTNPINLKEKEKIVKSLLTKQTEEKKINSFPKHQEFKRTFKENTNLMSRIFESDYLRHDFDL